MTEEPVKELSEVDKIEAEALRMEAALAKLEAARARAAMGGKSLMTPPQPKKEISDKEYAEAALSGKILKA